LRGKRGTQERSGYVTVGDGQVRVRMFGTAGARPLLLLHEPPGGSVQMRELAAELGRERLVIVPDLPGNGESDPLVTSSANTHATALADAMSALGIETFDLYAEPLASSIAVQLAVLAPERVRRLVLDGVSLLAARQRAAMKRLYAPAIVPRSDGTHLHALWHMLRDIELNWPWYSREIESIRARDPDLSASRLNDRLVEVMKQLPKYGDAAVAAIDCPVQALLPLLTQPVLMLHDDSDVRHRDVRKASRLVTKAQVRPRPSGHAALAAECVRFLER
jgi:pimeloyl-ACP methyl ester carboxylesterase